VSIIYVGYNFHFCVLSNMIRTNYYEHNKIVPSIYHKTRLISF